MVDDKKSAVKPIRVGRGDSGGLILLCGKRNSSFPFHCMVGPDWPALILVYSLVICAHALVLGIVDSWPMVIIGIIGFVILLSSYTMVACSDPGIIYQEEVQQLSPDFAISPSLRGGVDVEEGQELTSHEESRENDAGEIELPGSREVKAPSLLLSSQSPGMIDCGQCDLKRPYSARHCYYCGVCVEDMDHHCPWCGKCIGKKNIFCFRIFIGMLCFQTYFLIGSLIYYVISVSQHWPLGPPDH